MKNIIQIITFIFITFSSFAQEKLIGEWQLSSQKKLTLAEDFSFVLAKGENIFSGTWVYDNKKSDSDELTLFFGSDLRKYRVDKIARNEIRLYDYSKEQILILARIKKHEPIRSKDIVNEPFKPTIINQDFGKIDHFNRGRFVFNPGYGLINYLDSLPEDLNEEFLSLSLLLENSVGSRIGLGVKLGYRAWSIPESSYELSLYTLAPRITYHPEITDKIDAYLGVSSVFQYGHLDNGISYSGKWNMDVTPVVGVRYYVLNWLALTGEYAYDTSSQVTLGLGLLFN